MPTPGGFEQKVYVLSTEPAAWPTAITAAAVNAGVAVHVDLPDPLNFAGTTNRMDTSVIANRQDNSEPGTLTLDSLVVEAFRRKGAAQSIAIDALDDNTPYWIVKIEGGNQAGATPAAADIVDAAAVVVGTKSDVDTPRGDPRRMSIPMEIIETVVRNLALT